MQQVLKRARKNKKIKLFKNLNHILYLSTMKNADVMVGNSSSGLIEAPSLQTPYVLIGTRQSGRERAKSVIQVDYKKAQIVTAAKKAMRKKLGKVKNPFDPFGDGRAGVRIARILKKVKINEGLIQKRMAY